MYHYLIARYTNCSSYWLLVVTRVANEVAELLATDERTAISGTDPAGCQQVLGRTTSGFSSKFTHELARGSTRPVSPVRL